MSEDAGGGKPMNFDWAQKKKAPMGAFFHS